MKHVTPFVVKNSKMPKGVEHVVGGDWDDLLQRVKNSKMPKGVEHSKAA